MTSLESDWINFTSRYLSMISSALTARQMASCALRAHVSCALNLFLAAALLARYMGLNIFFFLDVEHCRSSCWRSVSLTRNIIPATHWARCNDGSSNAARTVQPRQEIRIKLSRYNICNSNNGCLMVSEVLLFAKGMSSAHTEQAKTIWKVDLK